MLANETLSNLRIVCFEGGDVCGKTTQVELFTRKVPRAIVVHFPRMYAKAFTKELHAIYESLERTIYDKKYIKNLIENGSISDLTILRQKLSSNISINYNDKLDFLSHTTLEQMIKGYGIIDLDIRVYKNGVHLTDKDDISSFYKEVRENDCNPPYILLDRFNLSHIIYNKLVPTYVLLQYREEIENENFLITFDNMIEELITQGNNSFNILQERFNNLLSAISIVDYTKLKQLHPAIVTILFKSSDILYEDYLNAKPEDRVKSVFDVNLQIRTIVTEIYNKLYGHTNNVDVNGDLDFKNYKTVLNGWTQSFIPLDTDRQINKGLNKYDISDKLFEKVKAYYDRYDASICEIHNNVEKMLTENYVV